MEEAVATVTTNDPRSEKTYPLPPGALLRPATLLAREVEDNQFVREAGVCRTRIRPETARVPAGPMLAPPKEGLVNTVTLTDPVLGKLLEIAEERAGDENVNAKESDPPAENRLTPLGRVGALLGPMAVITNTPEIAPMLATPPVGLVYLT